ncbi:Peroxisomal membrane protein 4, partial [Cladochytrium tenue]
PRDKMRVILKATYQHSRNLAFFVTIYKTLLVVLRRLKGREDSADAFVAGLVGGYVVFGEDNNINQQIVLYVFSRIMMGLAKLTVKKGVIPQPPHAFSIFAAVTWATVMWLFRHERDVLQGSLQASMQYLYNDSEVFSTFRNWLWHNR